jgi:hypothetical protein
MTVAVETIILNTPLGRRPIMTTKTPQSTVDQVAADLLRDVAFALRMARKVSAEIRRDAAHHAAVPASLAQEHWKSSGQSVTLGA